MIAALSISLLAGLSGDESRYYAVDYLPTPAGERLEVGGMDFLPDGRLAVSTRRGQVWLVSEALAEDPAAARFELFAEGLQEGLGLAVVEGELYVLQRGELSSLHDDDGDGRCDRVDTISDDWGLSGNYHEFAFGLPRDDEGNFYVGLNLGFFDPEWWHGKSKAEWRGWILSIAPDGTTTPFACGFRSPCGVARNVAGDLFVTDNQGDWIASSPIYHVREGRFYGHPASLEWTREYRNSQTLASDTVPPAAERTPPALWLPYKWSRSTGNLIEDASGGKFGPFAGDLLVAELTNGMVLRAQLERVRGEYQGACWPLRQRVGSVARLLQAPDGTLFAGLTNRGWGGLPPSDGIAHVRWTGETPMEMRRVHLLQDGFEIAFTKPVAAEVELAPEDVQLTQYDYDYWWEYGSPERATHAVPVTSLELSPDRTTLTLHTAGLTPAMCARCVVSDVVADDGAPLLHPEFSYTINQLPEGEPTKELVAKLVPPPPARESGAQGWLRLTWGDATDLWEHEGWVVRDAELDLDDPRRFRLTDGDGALVNAGNEAPSELVSEVQLGDGDLHLDFMLPQAGNSGVYLQGRYELQFLDSSGVEVPGFGDCGGIYQGERWPGQAPAFNAFQGPGLWHSLDLSFEAPRFDEAGHKVRNARFVRVLIDDVLLHENVEVPEPTGGGFEGEVALGPLRIQGDHGPVALRDVRFRPRRAGEPDDEAGFVPMLADGELDGWTATGDASWEVEKGTITGQGPRGHLFSPRGDYTDFEVSAQIKISDGGNSGLYVRTATEPEWPAGYEAQINSTFADPQKTASLYGLAPVAVALVGADTWFDYAVRCVDEPEGVRITISVNGVVITDHLDRERRHARGHVALQQHHEGSVIEVRDLRIRELR